MSYCQSRSLGTYQWTGLIPREYLSYLAHEACDQNRNKLHTRALPSCQLRKCGVSLILEKQKQEEDEYSGVPTKSKGLGSTSMEGNPSGKIINAFRPLKDLNFQENSSCSLMNLICFFSPGHESTESQAQKNSTFIAKLLRMSTKDYANFFFQSSHSYLQVPL